MRRDLEVLAVHLVRVVGHAEIRKKRGGEVDRPRRVEDAGRHAGAREQEGDDRLAPRERAVAGDVSLREAVAVLRRDEDVGGARRVEELGQLDDEIGILRLRRRLEPFVGLVGGADERRGGRPGVAERVLSLQDAVQIERLEAVAILAHDLGPAGGAVERDRSGRVAARDDEPHLGRAGERRGEERRGRRLQGSAARGARLPPAPRGAKRARHFFGRPVRGQPDHDAPVGADGDHGVAHVVGLVLPRDRDENAVPEAAVGLRGVRPQRAVHELVRVDERPVRAVSVVADEDEEDPFVEVPPLEPAQEAPERAVDRDHRPRGTPGSPARSRARPRPCRRSAPRRGAARVPPPRRRRTRRRRRRASCGPGTTSRCGRTRR